MMCLQVWRTALLLGMWGWHVDVVGVGVGLVLGG